MFRVFLVAVLTLTVVACPLRCLAGPCENRDAKASCECCRSQCGLSRCETDAEHSERRAPADDDRDSEGCGCVCLCKGATLAERQQFNIDAAASNDMLADASVTIGLQITADSLGLTSQTRSNDLRPSGRSLRFLLASLQL